MEYHREAPLASKLEAFASFIVSPGASAGEYDGIPNLTIIAAIAEAPCMFGSAMQKCQDERVFPETSRRRGRPLPVFYQLPILSM